MKQSNTKKFDCFAYVEKKEIAGANEIVITDCSALKRMLCVKGICPFYKNIDQHREELMQLHGTAGLDTILKEYEKQSGKVGCHDEGEA